MVTIQHAFIIEPRVRVVPEGQERERLRAALGPGGKESIVIVGDSNSVLARLPAGSFQTCVTSPPY